MLRARRTPHLAGANREWAGTVDKPLQAHLRELHWVAHVVVQGLTFLQAHDRARLVVILKILTDARCIGYYVDPALAQQRSRTNAGKLEQLWRLNCAAR